MNSRYEVDLAQMPLFKGSLDSISSELAIRETCCQALG